MPRPKKTDNENTLLQEEKWTGKAKIHSKTLKDTSVVLLDGITVIFDKDGIAEVEEERVAKYLLSIPSYELVKSDAKTSTTETIEDAGTKQAGTKQAGTKQDVEENNLKENA